MTEEQLLALGFEQQTETSEPSFYYYTLDIAEGLCFITQASDEVKIEGYRKSVPMEENGEWIAEILETTPAIKFKDAKKLRILIDILNQNKEDE